VDIHNWLNQINEFKFFKCGILKFDHLSIIDNNKCYITINIPEFLEVEPLLIEIINPPIDFYISCLSELINIIELNIIWLVTNNLYQT